MTSWYARIEAEIGPRPKTRLPCITSLLGTEPRAALPRKAWDRMLAALSVPRPLTDAAFDAYTVEWLQRQDAATKTRKAT